MVSDGDLTQALLDWFSVFTKRTVHDSLRYNRGLGLSLDQMNLLIWLFYHPSCEVSDFSQIKQVSRAAASQMVERMVQQGLVVRAESLEDRRVKRVTLSDHGRQVVEAAIASRRKWIETLVTRLGLEEKQRAVEVLAMLTERMRQLEEPDPAAEATEQSS